jgi:DNA-binding NarL/FixJ family response regulator
VTAPEARRSTHEKNPRSPRNRPDFAGFRNYSDTQNERGRLIALVLRSASERAVQVADRQPLLADRGFRKTETVPSKTPARVLLVSDRPVVLAGLSRIIDRDPSLKVVGEALTMTDAVRRARDADPEVMIVCAPLRELGGPQLVRRLQGASPQAKILGFCMAENGKLADEMIRAGALSCLPADADVRSVLEAARVAAGAKPRRPRRAEGPVEGSTAPPGSPLSQRELQVLTLIAEGNTNKEIAENLGISVRTVETHRERVMRKLNAQGTAALTKWAISLGLVNHG